MEKKTWKTIGIVFFILWILTTTILVWLLVVGTNIVENEEECAINICGEYETYYYDYMEDICYCFVDEEITHTEVMN